MFYRSLIATEPHGSRPAAEDAQKALEKLLVLLRFDEHHRFVSNLYQSPEGMPARYANDQEGSKQIRTSFANGKIYCASEIDHGFRTFYGGPEQAS